MAVPDAAMRSHVPKKSLARGLPGASAPRRDLSEDFAPRRSTVSAAAGLDDENAHSVPPRNFGGLRFRLRGGVPRSVIGRVVAGCLLLLALGALTAALWQARSMLLSNPRLVIASSEAIQITGNRHLTRPQLLSVFGEDVDRNILSVPLAERRAELERLPWVQHATVMRLMPDHLKVAIEERTPVAFVRQGGLIGLVDGSGVVLDLDSDGEGDQARQRYSFPVVTGISAQEPLSTRMARMRLYRRFQSDLDSGTDKVSERLSEVDLSSPEDLKALIPDGGTDVLVHFGDKDFLRRYALFQKNLPAWKKDYPKLASADMRYERQVVLEMAPGAAVPVAATGGESPKPDSLVKVSTKAAARLPARHAASPAPLIRPGIAHLQGPAAPHLTTAFEVHAATQSKPTQPEPR